MSTTGLTLGSSTTKMPGSPRALPAHACYIRHGEFAVAIPAAVSVNQFTPNSLKMR